MLPQPLRKAAILLASLDPASADGLLRQMDPQQAVRLRTAAAELEVIDEDEQRQIISEFVSRGPRPAEPELPGIELDDRLKNHLRRPSLLEGTDEAPAALRPSTSAAGRGQARTWQPDSAPPFGFLDEIETEYLAPALADEHPQTIALVVSHLAPPRAADVLAGLAGAVQVEVVRRMLDLEEADPEVLRDVELAVEARVQAEQRRDRRRAAGIATVMKLLKAADDHHEEQILTNVAVHDEQLASVLHHRGSSLARLDELDDRGLVTLIEAADPQLTVLALAGWSGELLERLLRQFPPGEAQRLGRALRAMGPTRLSDMEEAQAQLLELAGNLHAAGRVSCRSAARINTAA